MALERSIRPTDNDTELALKELDVRLLQSRIGIGPLDDPFIHHSYIIDGDLFYYDGTQYVQFSSGNILNIVNVTTDYSVTDTDNYVSCNGTLTVTLPATPVNGRVIQVSNQGSGVITVSGNGNTVESDITLTIGNGTAQLIYNEENTDWEIK